ncbi:hypothetical protein E3N88_41700 [Mikania micrantha]|uniref:Peptidase A2 domain-containing protein n=1 Tax=Mikania micrantha TaxID=192012 RepID=A0A5N6LJV4_9ASTR|nr:hypothetical protein E3N88_41700 [Mikania micrantha]
MNRHDASSRRTNSLYQEDNIRVRVDVWDDGVVDEGDQRYQGGWDNENHDDGYGYQGHQHYDHPNLGYQEEEGDLGAPIIQIQIGEVKTNKALLDYGASVSILPGNIYDQYEFSPLHPVDITVVLADSTCRRPRGMLVGVAVKIREFCYPEDFLVLDYEPITKKEQPTVILGRPFLATANAQINCRDNTVSMTFGY